MDFRIGDNLADQFIIIQRCWRAIFSNPPLRSWQERDVQSLAVGLSFSSRRESVEPHAESV